ncbi:Glycerophosphoryl diester phosphodiesterase [Alkalibacterium sp. AK22]|uniref:glycerophosphodiester phosphodiesterase n=1 Tax=Alkalibacterium sp. AK22 TaxID=1229520 RepID=UPI00044FD3A4|nr:glycerophosphodiester phosphodiesterase [Alkalibacterium sp. AK22]EXJ22944.1 Glycerophosphoryl diester phosphodiesterase [Alkalibacterium sp. AK22]
MRKWFKGLGFVFSLIFLVWLVLFLFPLSSESEHAFLKDKDRPLVIAHRGGMTHRPENTLEAFQHADELGVDMLEYDVFITADGELVVIHDDTVDRTTDGTGRVNDLKLEDIRSLDAGYRFVDEQGNTSYRGIGVRVPTVEEVFQTFGHKRQLIELKATNDPERYEEMIQEMWRLIEAYDMHECVLIASFDHDINTRFDEVAGGQVAIGAGEQQARRFVIAHKAFANLLYRPSAQAYQLPIEQDGFNLMDWKLIRGASNRGLHVYYWTINEKETMRELIDLGAHGIMTDNIEGLMNVINE